jgi:hypothetical protein
MAGICLLDGIYGKRANRVDAQLIELCAGGDRLVTDSHLSSPRKTVCLGHFKIG